MYLVYNYNTLLWLKITNKSTYQSVFTLIIHFTDSFSLGSKRTPTRFLKLTEIYLRYDVVDCTIWKTTKFPINSCNIKYHLWRIRKLWAPKQVWGPYGPQSVCLGLTNQLTSFFIIRIVEYLYDGKQLELQCTVPIRSFLIRNSRN